MFLSYGSYANITQGKLHGTLSNSLCRTDWMALISVTCLIAILCMAIGCELYIYRYNEEMADIIIGVQNFSTLFRKTLDCTYVEYLY